MKIDYDKDFKKVMTELQTNFGWSNIEMLPDSYKDFLNDTIKAVKNCSIPNVVKSLPKDTDGCNINSVSNYFHCQREEEMESKCTNQCDHCKEYYKPLEQ